MESGGCLGCDGGIWHLQADQWTAFPEGAVRVEFVQLGPDLFTDF